MLWPMDKVNDIRTGRHCVFAMHVHLVFLTKYRKDVLTAPMLESLHVLFSKVCTDFEAELVEFNGEDDHVHLLVNYPPKVPISGLVNSLKGASSRVLRSQFPELKKKLWKGALWSPSYFSGSCGGASINVIKKYIELQDTPKN